MKCSILTVVTGFAAAANCAAVLFPRQAPTNHYVTVNAVAGGGFVPDRLFNVKPGDQVTFVTDPATDHHIVQAIPQDYCVPVAGGLDSGIRYAGTPSTYVYAVPDPFPYPAIEFYDSALVEEGVGCAQIGIYNGDTEPAGV